MGSPPPVLGGRLPAVVGGSIDRWSWTQEIAPGATVDKLFNLPEVWGGQLIVYVTGSGLFVTITRRTPRANHPVRMELGPGAQQVVDLFGAVEVSAQNPTQTAATIALALIAGPIRSLPPVSSTVSVMAAVVGVPGPWVTLPTPGETIDGYPPGQRYFCQLQCSGGPVAFQWVDGPGTARADFELAGTGPGADAGGIQSLIHPPQYVLQARHPADVANTRQVLVTWYREQK